MPYSSLLLAICASLLWSGLWQAECLRQAANSIPDLVHPYPLEQYTVQTEDGYLLSLFRIPYGLKERKAPWRPAGTLRTRYSNKGQLEPDEARPVVYLQHGLLDSCAGFLLAGPDQALAFLLADAGYDVWLGNSRGSTQSRAHAWLSTSSSEYWSFSFDEMAKYDLPASLNKVLAVTGQPHAHFVSHSQGGTILLAALSSQPQLADQLGLIQLMAPVATGRHMTSVPLQAMAALGTEGMFNLLGVHEFLPSMRMVSWLEGRLCTTEPSLCISILAAICGYRRNFVNATRLPLYLQYTPAGSSVQNMAHWAQNVRGGASPGHPELAYFDYGTQCDNNMGLLKDSARSKCNQEEYGSTVPPVYHLYNIPNHTRMIIYTGGQDRLADPIDVELMLEMLPQGVLLSHQYDPQLEHLDYIWGYDAPERVYFKIVHALDSWIAGEKQDAQRLALKHSTSETRTVALA